MAELKRKIRLVNFDCDQLSQLEKDLSGLDVEVVELPYLDVEGEDLPEEPEAIIEGIYDILICTKNTQYLHHTMKDGPRLIIGASEKEYYKECWEDFGIEFYHLPKQYQDLVNKIKDFYKEE